MTLLSALRARITRPRGDDCAAVRPLWHAIVALARTPQWYREGGIADTVSGRFDAITLVLALVLLRMERDPALIPASARLTELFVTDMDGQLRQSGVGDLVVGKHVGKLMGVLGGRLSAYRAALAADDPAALAAAVSRNIAFADKHDPAPIAHEARTLAARLEALSPEALLAGRIA